MTLKSILELVDSSEASCLSWQHDAGLEKASVQQYSLEDLESVGLSIVLGRDLFGQVVLWS
jgi:hypothetical protein